jgi:DHA1 family tetracycline resistance protein-like MFS transporter
MGFTDAIIVLDGVDREGRDVLLRVYLTWFMISAAFAVLHATLPLILLDIVGKEEAPKYQGWMTATTAASGLVLCSLTGHLSDRFGRVTVFKVWSIAFAFGVFLVAIGARVNAVEYLFVARLAPVSVAFFVSLALCADVARGPALLQSHGHIGAVHGAAALFGSLAAGVVGHFSGRIAAVMSGFAFALVAALTTFSINAPPPQKGAHTSFIDALKVIARDPLLLLCVIGFAMIRVGNVNVAVFYVLYASYRFDWTIWEISVLLGIRGALSVYLQTVCTQQLSRLPPKTTITALMWFLVSHPVTMVMMGASWDGKTFAITSLVNTVSFVAISILTTKVAALSHKDGISGLALGAVGSLQNFIEIFVALVCGAFLQYAVKHIPADSPFAGLPFYANAIWFTAACVVFWVADRFYGDGRPGWRIEATDMSDTETEDDTGVIL